jgi:o-succinylbenzoate---CoA ligase
VVPETRLTPPDLARIRSAVKSELPAYAAPRELVIVEELPRTPLGKIRRTSLD